MANQDRWNEERDRYDRYRRGDDADYGQSDYQGSRQMGGQSRSFREPRDAGYPGRRYEEDGYLESGYGEGGGGYSRPQLSRGAGPVSYGPSVGDPSTSGRYYEDYSGRADFGGYGGGAYGLGGGRPRRSSYRAGRGYEESGGSFGSTYGGRDAETQYAGGQYPGEPRYGSYGGDNDYRPASSVYGAGGYTPNPRQGDREQERGWMDRTSDEVASWFGDRDAERRRAWDARAEGQHRGRGPKGYQRSDARIHEDVNDRLTDDPLIDASEIEVAVASSEVTLTGTVHSREIKRRAEDVVEHITGVTHVQNNLRVRRLQEGSGGPTLAGQTDPRIASVTDGEKQQKIDDDKRTAH